MKQTPLILVIDDDPDICSMIKLMLEYHGYVVMSSDNESGARSILSDNKVDLIIMDMLLSGFDGRDFCRQLKAAHETSAIPVLMFSAHPNAKQSCIDAGADDFIGKPFEMQELLGKLRNCLNSKQPTS